MYSVVILSLALVLTVAGVNLDFEPVSCVHQGVVCCKKDFGDQNELKIAMRVCFDPPPDPETCDFYSCLGQKMGFASSNGTISREGYLKHIESLFKSNPDFVEHLKKTCMDGDISKYGENYCDARKLQTCTSVQYFKICDEWRNESRCEGSKEAAEKCIKTFEKE